MKRMFALLVVGMLIVAAGRADDAPAAPAVCRIVGTVIKMTGDFMPGPGTSKGKRAPLSVPVWVFKGVVDPIDTPDPKHPQLLTIVKSDAEGRYSVDLPGPGVYTVVAEINGKLYLNNYDGDGHWASIEMKDHSTVAWIIEDSSEATF